MHLRHYTISEYGLFIYRDYVRLTWNCGNFLAVLFVIINMVAQLAGCLMVILRKYVSVAVGILFGVIILQVISDIKLLILV